MEFLLPLSFLIISLVIGFALHEAGHAYAANHLGDPTARHLGRLTVNPLPHLDPFGTVLLPLILIAAQWPIIQQGGTPFVFAAAKPVPVNPNNFKRPFADFAFVAAAGPMVNIALFLLAALAFNFVSPGTVSAQFLGTFLWINMVLAFFNLFPCPPLDGSKIVAAFLPRNIARQIFALDRVGFLILIAIIILGRQTGFDIIRIWVGFGVQMASPAIDFLATLLR